MSNVPASPLVRVERGQLRPKVLSLYEELFSGNLSKSDSYWTEFFLLRCNRPALAATIDALTPEKLLACRQVTHDLFVHATEQLKSTHAGTVENTLNILVIYFTVIFSKKFVSYSSDVISVISGLESIDKVFYKFLDAISALIGNSKAVLTTRVAAVRTVTIIAGCAYKTALASCFLYRDMFGAVIDFVNSPECQLYIGDALSLLGILASYDKLEEINPYQVRLADFVDDSSMQSMARASGDAWEICLNQYIHYAEDISKKTASASAFGSLAFWTGNRSSKEINGERQDEPDEAHSGSEASESLPHPTISLLLANYEFFNANRVYTRKFLEQQSSGDGSKAPPVVLFVSLCSYLLQEQTHSSRSEAYARLALIVLRNWMENVPQLLLKIPASQFHLANYRQPPLEISHEPLYLLDSVLYCLNICIRFNMKKKLDYNMYTLCLEITYEALDFLAQAHVRFQYRWKDLWRTLVTLTHFMSHHPPDTVDSQASYCAELLLLIVAHCLIYGTSFLCTDDEFDDLYYKVVQSSESFRQLIETYQIENSWPAKAVSTTCAYFTELIDKKQHQDDSDNRFPGIGKILTLALNPFSGSDGLDSMQVLKTIRNGMGGLSLAEYAKPHECPVKRYREADERLFLKKITKIVVQDVTYLYS